jgi:ribose 1,5-bisphosphokinase PhnN
LISAGLFLAVIGISYGLSTGVETPLKDGEVLSASGSRWVGAGLRAFYILAVVAIGAMVLSGAKRIFNK